MIREVIGAYRANGLKHPFKSARIAQALISRDIDTSGYLKEFAKNGTQLWSRDESAYYIKSLSHRPSKGCGNCIFYHDTKHSFVLSNNNSNNMYGSLALVGFDLDSSLRVKVKQIQALKGSPGTQNDKNYQLLQPLKWERMLLKIVTDWASEAGFEQVWVQGATNNTWNRLDSNVAFRMRYDVTARRSGFRLDKQSGDYYLDL